MVGCTRHNHPTSLQEKGAPVLLNHTQQMHVRNVRAANKAWRVAKTEALARAKKLAAEEIAAYQHQMDLEVRLAFEAGVPKSQIGKEGMLTSAPKTVLDSLARTAGLATATAAPLQTRQTDPLADRYQATTPADPTQPQTLTVTLDADTLEAAMIAVRVDHSARAAVARDFGGPTKFAVDRDDFGGRRFTPEPIEGVDPSGFIFALGERHPVWAWMQQSENRAEAAAWMAGRDMNEAAA